MTLRKRSEPKAEFAPDGAQRQSGARSTQIEDAIPDASADPANLSGYRLKDAVRCFSPGTFANIIARPDRCATRTGAATPQPLLRA
jgi:hypothetical protein